MNKVVRVLQIGMHDKIGGVETFLMNYYRNINKKKIQFDFICDKKELCFEDEIKSMKGIVYKVPNVKRNPIQYYRAIRKIIKENKYKIVHINMLSMANILPIIVANKEKVPHIILHSHNTGTPKGLLRKILDKFNKNIAIKKATDYFACSKLAGEWLYKGKVNFKVINNAIDVQKFQFDEERRNHIRKALGIDRNFVVGHIGRFSEQKNHKFLVRMFAELVKKVENAKLLLIGEGELKLEIQKMIEDLKIKNNVIMLEPKSNIQDYYQAMDVFVLPSKFEGLGIVLVEAQANGLPCVYSDCITKEAKIIPNTTRLPLENLKWIEELSKEKKRISKKEATLLIEKNGFSIKKEVGKLEDMYMKFEEDAI